MGRGFDPHRAHSLPSAPAVTMSPRGLLRAWSNSGPSRSASEMSSQAAISTSSEIENSLLPFNRTLTALLAIPM